MYKTGRKRTEMYITGTDIYKNDATTSRCIQEQDKESTVVTQITLMHGNEGNYTA
jgi:hypothetical protein